MNKFVLTNVPVEAPDKNSLVGALFQNERLEAISCYAPEKDNLKNIYVARVDSIAENIHAFFVRISKNEICFVPYEDLKYAIFTKKISKKELAVGDELLVQINRLPLKTKQATATTRICLAGRYVAITYGPYRLSVSKKISAKRNEELKEFLSRHHEAFHDMELIARTNCQTADTSEILEEAIFLSDKMKDLVNTASSKTLYSCLYTTPPRYVQDIINSYEGEIDEVITDLPAYYEEIQSAFQDKLSPSKRPLLRFYEDSYSLCNLFSLKKEIQDLISEKVWLKSGAYLIIQPTEALTVIDVNSGKNIKKNKNDYYLTVNLEAAQEIARQLKLRNISGICIIDFIDLPEESQRNELIRFMRDKCRNDRVPTTVVDMTKLHLMEITRKKTDPTLYEQIFHHFS
ncbi:MAG: ribonuclease E/G [Lachnospiraceae bacterium]